MARVHIALAGLLLSLLVPSAVSAQAPKAPPEEPILRIEPGMHTAPIRGIGLDAACSLIATGSDDKTVRLWRFVRDHTALEPVRTLRVPIGAGNDGKVQSVGLSPDGRLVAVGFWAMTGGDNRLHVYDLVSGHMVFRSDVIYGGFGQLAFSRDGSRLVAGLLGDGKGVRVWNTKSWALIGSDTDYNGKDAYGVAFDAAGRLFTGSYDGHLRRYELGQDGTYKLTGKVLTAPGATPFRIAIHPSGDRVAVGYSRGTSVDVFDARTMTRVLSAQAGSKDAGDLSTVGWSIDGRRLYGAGTYDVGGPNPLRMWDDGGKGKARDLLTGSLDTVMEVRPCGAGQNRDLVLFGSQDPAIGLLDGGGQRRLWQGSVIPDQRGKRSGHFFISADGRKVHFGLEEWSGTPVIFDFGSEQLIDGAVRPPDFAEALTSGVNVTDWINNYEPKLNGRKIELLPYEISRSLAITPDRQRLVLGTEWRLRAFKADGSPLWQRSTPAIAWGVNITRDGRLLVAAYGDGTIRWHRMSDGQELLALFVHKLDRRWVAWTPKGYYLASPGAESLIGWHLNRGWDKLADFVTADRFREQFARPDIVKLALELSDEDKAIDEANRRSRRSRTVEDVRAHAPPIIVIQKPTENASFRSREVTIEYYALSPTGQRITDVDVRINGNVLATRAPLPPTPRGGEPVRLTLSLPPQDVTVTLVAREGAKASEPAQLKLRWDGAKPGEVELPRLRALFVGNNGYTHKTLPKLGFAAKDAADLDRFFKSQQGKAYSRVETRLLTDAKRADVLEGLEWLEKGSEEGDINLLFLAGHGVTDEQQHYYFMTTDSDADRPRATGVSRDEILRTIRQRRGGMVVMLDTCHAGASQDTSGPSLSRVDMNRLANEIGDKTLGVFLYASALGRQLSEERSDWGRGGNGAFTAALLEGLSGGADREKLGHVDSDELALFVRRRVMTLTERRQEPVRMKPDAAPEMKLSLTR